MTRCARRSNGWSADEPERTAVTQKSITPDIALAFGRDVYFGHGKIEILPKVAVHGVEDIAIAFTPGVGHAVKLIASDPETIHEQTAKDRCAHSATA